MHIKTRFTLGHIQTSTNLSDIQRGINHVVHKQANTQSWKANVISDQKSKHLQRYLVISPSSTKTIITNNPVLYKFSDMICYSYWYIDAYIFKKKLYPTMQCKTDWTEMFLTSLTIHKERINHKEGENI